VSEAQEPPKPASTKPEAPKPEPPKPEPQPQDAKPDPPKTPPTPDKAETKAKPEPEKSKPAEEKPSKAEKPAPKNASPAAKSAAKAEAKAALKAAEKKPASSGQSSPKAANGARLAYGDTAMPKQAESALQRAGVPYPGFDPDNFRAVALPMPTDTGSELVSYKEIVFGLLERAKHYPETAMERGARGAAVIGFTLDSDGKIVDLQLLQSSGEADLDVESLALVDRAAPFPLPPPGAQRSFSAEVRFGVEEIEP
jgi:colicin import membrane protein